MACIAPCTAHNDGKASQLLQRHRHHHRHHQQQNLQLCIDALATALKDQARHCTTPHRHQEKHQQWAAAAASDGAAPTTAVLTKHERAHLALWTARQLDAPKQSSSQHHRSLFIKAMRKRRILNACVTPDGHMDVLEDENRHWDNGNKGGRRPGTTDTDPDNIAVRCSFTPDAFHLKRKFRVIFVCDSLFACVQAFLHIHSDGASHLADAAAAAAQLSSGGSRKPLLHALGDAWAQHLSHAMQDRGPLQLRGRTAILHVKGRDSRSGDQQHSVVPIALNGFINFCVPHRDGERKDIPLQISTKIGDAAAAAVSQQQSLGEANMDAIHTASDVSMPTFSFSAVGVMESPFVEKHGTPRQGGAAPATRGTLRLFLPLSNGSVRREQEAENGEDDEVGTSSERAPPTVRHRQSTLSLLQLDIVDGSDVYILFVFHLNTNKHFRAHVKAPRLDGARTGVFATRSPHRANPLGLTRCHVERVDLTKGRIELSGIDLVDGTPVLAVWPCFMDPNVPSKSLNAHFPSWVVPVAASPGDEAQQAGKGPRPRVAVTFTPLAWLQLNQVCARPHALKFYDTVQGVREAIEQTLALDPRTQHTKKQSSDTGISGIYVDQLEVVFRWRNATNAPDNGTPSRGTTFEVCMIEHVNAPLSPAAAASASPAASRNRPALRSAPWLEQVKRKLSILENG